MQVLGPVRAWVGGREVALGAPKQRAVFSVLALRHGRSVSLGELIDALWEGDCPTSAESLVYTYISRLRRALDPASGQAAGARSLCSAGSGYSLRLDASRYDLSRFEDRLWQAKQERAAGRPHAAADALATALAQWRGEPLAAVPGPFADTQRVRLNEMRLAAVEQRAEVAMEVGRHAELVGELGALVREHPLRERLCELLMLALYRCGRQAEALARFAEVRLTLVDQLGVEPGPKLRQLHTRILACDPSLQLPAAAAPPLAAAPPGPQRVVPAQLPHDLADFTARSKEVARVEEVAEAAAGGTASVLVVSGVAGVGKTALAVHCGHRTADRFPDGQLYVNLRGFDPVGPPMPSGTALEHLLYGVGVDPSRIPADLDQRAALYRSLLAGKRVLVVLDNAVTADQVRPLLPGGAHSLVLITSRNRLSDLMVRDGARSMVLGVFDTAAAQGLWAGMVGADEGADTAAVGTLADLCGHLPLALRIVGERVARMHSPDLGAVVRDLASRAERRLDALDVEGDECPGVRAAFSWSCRMLPPGAARMFRLLGLHRGPDIGVQAAAALADAAVHEARAMLGCLAAGHLIESAGPDRYRFHDLLRMYAVERSAAEEPAQDRAAASARLIRWYVHAAAAADRALAPHRRHEPVGPPPDRFAVPRFSAHDGALEWCEVERANLVAVGEQAARTEGGAAWQLPIALWSFFALRTYASDWLVTTRRGLECARRAGNRSAQGHLLASLGNAEHALRRFQAALDCFAEAETIFHSIGDPWGRAATLVLRSNTDTSLRRLDAAEDGLRAALVLFRDCRGEWGEGWALHSLGLIGLRRGRLEDALENIRAALVLFRRIGDRWGESWCLHSAGLVHRDLGQLDKADVHFRRSGAVCEAVGNRQGEGQALLGLARTGRERGLFPDAAQHAGRAVEVFRDAEDRSGEAVALRELGMCLLAAGDDRAARAAWSAALGILVELGDPRASRVRRQLDGIKVPG